MDGNNTRWFGRLEIGDSCFVEQLKDNRKSYDFCYIFEESFGLHLKKIKNHVF